MKYSKISLKKSNFYFKPKSYLKTVLIRKNLAFLVEKPKSLFSIVAMLFSCVFNNQLYNTINNFNKEVVIHKKHLMVWLHVTNDCNLACSYCYLSHTSTKMSKSIVDKIIKQINSVIKDEGYEKVTIKLSGGEALLELDLIKYIIKELKTTAFGNLFEFVILSNGTIYNEKIAHFIKKNNVKLMISLDGIGKFQDRHRKYAKGAGTYSTVLKNIDKFLFKGIKPYISSVLTSENIKGLKGLLDFCNKKELAFSLNLVKSNNKDILVSYAQFKKEWENASEVIREIAKKSSLLGNIIDSLVIGFTREYSCLAGRDYLVFNSWGEILRCQREISSSQGMANLHCDDGYKIMETIRSERENSWNSVNVDNLNKCQYCPIKYFCAGSCPIFRRFLEDSNTPCDYCQIYNFVFSSILSLIDDHS